MTAPSEDKDIASAKDLLRGKEASAQKLFDHAKVLKKAQRFDLARRLLAKAQRVVEPEEQQLAVKIAQQRASCTEKDPDLPVDHRSREAEKILASVLSEAEQFTRRPPDQRSDRNEIGQRQETLGIAGAIHKRRWQTDPQPQHLVRSFQLYEKGYLLGVEPDRPDLPDDGYTGINAAFVLDLLAQQEGAENPREQELLREKARAIRGKLIEKLTLRPDETRKNWWALATLIEAFFGRSEYDEAKDWIEAAKEFKATLDSWEYETFVKQLAMIATLQESSDRATEADHRQSGAWKTLSNFVEKDAAGLPTVFSGKVGLALSGGGFRASFFHIGVLARLAELDMLRHVEVLSCVSGGSIIGALYYLHLRNLLEDAAKNGQTEIPREAYIELVRKMSEQFLKTVQTNPRMVVFSKLTGLPSRTSRMGELLDRELYGPVAESKEGERPLLRDLRVAFPNEPRFNPKYENWRRRDKVPILILNATTLNTGHNWQFTASFMGESPHSIDPDVDGNERLRRMYLETEAPGAHRDTPLGLAVAASAAVPGLFAPVKLEGLYPDRDVELVDGGVHDNQGIAGLLEQSCTVLLISDASGQLVSEPHPARNEFAVLLRSNDTLMARVRELQHKELLARQRARQIREFMFIHLKKDLIVDPVDWEDCDLPKEALALEGVSPSSDGLTRYGVRGKVQNLLSGIRTDLDAFTDAEALALMASGYKMARWDFPQCIRGFAIPAGEENDENPDRTDRISAWHFGRVNERLTRPGGSKLFLKMLQLGGSLLFKGPRLILGESRARVLVPAVGVLSFLIKPFSRHLSTTYLRAGSLDQIERP